MAGEDYRIIKLPIELAELIDDVLGKMGYKSRTEFVKDAVRHLLQAYGVLLIEERKPSE